ncbi:cation transporting ATPase C-terminal domain-containing protein, partial [Gottschalkia purinilytica]|uniref:cation transporting ATPase C-terminal domain-containing protein n=1 Tax=Gottschalkia purinilytica TaxID=1503 RepID=UPI001910778D
PALALGVDPADPDIMKRKPRDPSKSMFAGDLGFMIIVQGIMIGLLTLISFQIGVRTSLMHGRTMAFITLCFSQLVHALNVRSIDKSIFDIGLFKNKHLILANITSVLLVLGVIFITKLREIFKLVKLDAPHFIIVILISFIPLLIVEISKLCKK